MRAPVLHVRGQVLVGPDETADELWVVDGRVTFTDADRPVCRRRPDPRRAGCSRGSSTRTATSGSGRTARCLARRRSGRRSPIVTPARCSSATPASPATRAGSTSGTTCRRSSARAATSRAPVATSATTPTRSRRPTSIRHVRLEAHRGDGWVKLVGDWIDRDVGDLAPSWSRAAVAAAIAAAHEEGVRVTAHCFGEESLRDLAAAGIDCVEHATGLQEDSIDTFAAQGIAIVPTLVNIATFPTIAAPAKEKFPGYHQPHARPPRAALRHHRRSPRGRRADLRRHRCRAEACRTVSSARRWSS